MKTYKLNGYDIIVERSTYRHNDTLAIMLTIANDGESYAVITTNIDDSNIFCDESHAFVDTNNCPWAEEFIQKNDLGEPDGYYGVSGWCMYPLYKFNIEKIPVA